MSAGTARLQVLAAAILFSTGGAAIKMDAFTAAQTSCLRSGIAAVTLLLWLRGRFQWSWTVAAAAVAYAGILTLFVTATKLTTAANAILLQATAPNPALGNTLGAASGFVWALTLMALRYLGRDDRTGAAPVSAVVLGNVLACAVALPWAVPLPGASAGAWATLAYLGVFQIGLSYLLLSSAVGRLPALETSLLLLLEPVLNPVWAWLVHGEDPGSWTIVGGAVILGATALKVIVDSRATRD